MRVVSGTSLALLSACGLFGQPAQQPLSFEVASVKISKPAEGQGRGPRNSVVPSPAGVNMYSVPLKGAIQWAYHLQTIQVSGPGWIDSERYDIVARASGPVSTDQVRQMMQSLLAQRFKLEFHKETKEMPAYVVTIAKGGNKMKPSEGEGDMDVKPIAGGKMAATFTHVSLSQFSEMVSSPLQGVVVDQTGLKGGWDFTLDMSGFMMTQPTGIEDAVTMIIQAANEQLGIKIEQKKVPAEVLIVDHAERVPVEN